MKTKTFLVYADPGHSWAKVSKDFLLKLLGPHWRSCFTLFSYEKGNYVYLEEDEDVHRLIVHCREKGIEAVFKEGSTAERRSKIRSYPSLAPM